MKTIKAERELSLDFLRVTEAAAIESAKTMGQGDRKYSDHVAVEAMREAHKDGKLTATLIRRLHQGILEKSINGYKAQTILDAFLEAQQPQMANNGAD